MICHSFWLNGTVFYTLPHLRNLLPYESIPPQEEVKNLPPQPTLRILAPPVNSIHPKILFRKEYGKEGGGDLWNMAERHPVCTGNSNGFLIPPERTHLLV